MQKRTSAARRSSVSGRNTPPPPTAGASGSETTMAEEDLSVLRRPLSTALTGFQEAKRAYENGTEEVRRLLLHECCLIYECNVCRNMFRSLANFISHKRIFCCSSSTGGGYSNGFPDRNSALIIHDDLASADNAKRSRSTGASPVPRSGGGFYGVNGGLSNVIERLRREQVTTTTDHTTVLQLERVPTTSQAVYQTLMREEADSMRTEVDEVNNMLSSHLETVLGPDGKALTSSNKSNLGQKAQTTSADPSSSDNTAAATNNAVGDGCDPQLNDDLVQTATAAAAGHIMCDICNLGFQTEKTLKLHIQKKHISSAYVFQCPTCSLTFMQPAAVIRHLANEHKKPVRSIRMMRENILKRRIQAGDVKAAPTAANKGTSRELKRLQAGGGGHLAESDNNFANEEQRKLKSTCAFCEKSFERRAALSTHLNSCRAKYEAQEEAEKQQQRNNEIQLNAAASAAKTLSTCQPQIKISDSIKHVATATTSTALDDSANEMLNELFANLDKQTFGTGLQTVKLEMFETEDDDPENVATKEPPPVQQKVKVEKALADEFKDLIKRKKLLYGKNGSEARLTDDVGKQLLSTSAPQLPATPSYPAAAAAADIQAASNQTPLPTAKKKQRRFRIVPASAPASTKHLPCRCKICNKQFNALSNLRRHISMFHYRARKFGCKLCDYRAFRRYDIVNHLGFVHKMQGEREAMSAEWVNVHEVHYSKEDVDGDIVLCADEVATDELGGKGDSTPKTYAKRGGGKRKKQPPVQADTSLEDVAIAAALNENGGAVVKRTRRRQRQRLSLPAPDTTTTTAATTSAGSHKRPIRNRIKPVNKDFVYDLSNLLKTETDSGGGGSGGAGDGSDSRLKRQNTLYGSTDVFHGLYTTMAGGKNNSIAPLTPSSHVTAVALIHGAARRIALALVAQGRAASSTLPELPAERPQMRPRRLTATQARLDAPAGGVIGSRDLEAAAPTRLKTCSSGVLFEDSFLEKIARRSGFRMKPLMQVDTALSTLLQKVRSSANNNNCNSIISDTTATATITTNANANTNAAAFPNEVPQPMTSEAAAVAPPDINGKLHNPPTSPTFCSPASSAAATPIDFISYQVACATTASLEVAAAMLQQQQEQQHNSSSSISTSPQNGKHFFIEPDPSIPKSSSPPPTPRKRITLMQRLAENKANKHRESLLRSALEN